MNRLLSLISCLYTGLLASSITAVGAAESYLVMEANSGRVLLAANSEKKRPVASLTKIATAKVVLDWAELSQTSLSSHATVPQSILALAGPNPMGLRPGERIQLRDAMYSALLGSDNMAAHTLADHVGRSIMARRGVSGDPQEIFVHEMNQLAKSLGMRDTRFRTTHGLETDYRKGYSTAADMARMSVYAMRDVGFAFYVKQKSRIVSVTSPDGKARSFELQNTNPLLGELGVNGIKTGLTNAAGQCIAVNAHRSPVVKKIDDTRSQIRKRDLVVVILGSNDRIGRAKELINQAWPLYDHWAAAGFPVSPKARELMPVPQLR